MKGFKIEFNNISFQKTIRPDLKYREFWDFNQGRLIKIDGGYDYIKLSQVIEEIKIKKLKKGELSEAMPLLSISEQIGGNILLHQLKLEYVDEIGSDKNPLHDADIIISKLGLPKGYIFYNDKETYPNLIGSSELIPYKLISDKYHPLYLTHLLSHPDVLNNYSSLESGKTPSHWRVNSFDIINCLIPLTPYNIQLEKLEQLALINNQILNLEKEISSLKESSYNNFFI